jgi:hypothetical protein
MNVADIIKRQWYTLHAALNQVLKPIANPEHLPALLDGGECSGVYDCIDPRRRPASHQNPHFFSFRRTHLRAPQEQPPLVTFSTSFPNILTPSLAYGIICPTVCANYHFSNRRNFILGRCTLPVPSWKSPYKGVW